MWCVSWIKWPTIEKTRVQDEISEEETWKIKGVRRVEEEKNRDKLSQVNNKNARNWHRWEEMRREEEGRIIVNWLLVVNNETTLSVWPECKSGSKHLSLTLGLLHVWPFYSGKCVHVTGSEIFSSSSSLPVSHCVFHLLSLLLHLVSSSVSLSMRNLFMMRPLLSFSLPASLAFILLVVVTNFSSTESLSLLQLNTYDCFCLSRSFPSSLSVYQINNQSRS